MKYNYVQNNRIRLLFRTLVLSSELFGQFVNLHYEWNLTALLIVSSLVVWMVAETGRC